MVAEFDDFLSISALQHLLFCDRQCALIHVDGIWIDNGHTTAGNLLHTRVDAGGREDRPGVRVVRSMSLRSEALRLTGIADTVEFHATPGGEIVLPVEYKRGQRKAARHDDVQVAAQAMALEEMLGVGVPQGAIYYATSRRRRDVPIDAALRDLTQRTAARLHQMVAAREVPAPCLDERCADCSLHVACLPRVDRRTGALALALREVVT